MVSGVADATPRHTLSSAVLGTPQAVLFDAAGNLWVIDPGGLIKGKPTPALFEFSAAQIAALGSDAAPMPVTSITSATYLKYPVQAAFDLSGNLWVTDQAGSNLVVYSAAQLAKAGANEQNPGMVLSASTMQGPTGLAFDAGGNVWIAMHGRPANGATAATTGTTVVQFDLASLPGFPDGGTLTDLLMPVVILSDDGKGSIQAPWALTVDTLGNLWVSDSGKTPQVVSFSPAQMAKTGAPAPTVVLSSTSVNGVATFNAPHGLCFDDIDALAVTSSAGAYATAYFAPQQLGSGSPVPYTLLTGSATSLKNPGGCAFGAVAP
jgi:hypothetical protein